MFSHYKNALCDFNDVSTNLFVHPCCWCVHNPTDRCQSCILTVRCAATAKCTQLACVTFNYGSSTFHKTVIEPGALPLFKTTGALQFSLCSLKAPYLLIYTSWSLPVGPGGSIGEIGWTKAGLGCSRHCWGSMTIRHTTKQSATHQLHYFETKLIFPSSLKILEVRIHISVKKQFRYLEVVFSSYSSWHCWPLLSDWSFEVICRITEQASNVIF